MIENFRIVLVRPRKAGNVGAVARAMKNMGVLDLALVGPPPRQDRWGAALAVHARDVLDRSSRFATLPEAVSDCHVVVGTTCRRGGYRAGAESIEVMAPALAQHARWGRVALVFGPENHGLPNADLKHCQRLATIPVAAEYPSLNVAQAVLLCCYELRRALRSEAEAGVASVFAAAADVAFMLKRLQEAFLRIGFLHPDNPDHIMFTVRRLLGRTGLTPREVRIFLGLARQIEWYARQPLAARPATRVSRES